MRSETNMFILMYNIRIQLVSILLGLSSFAFSNEKDSTVIQTKQNKQEIFYIEDSGSALHLEGQNAENSAFVVSPIGAVIDSIDTKQSVLFFSKERKNDIVKDSTDEKDVSSKEVPEKVSNSEPALLASHNVVPIPIEMKQHDPAVVKPDSTQRGIEHGSDYVVKDNKIPDRDALVVDESQTEDDDYEGYLPTYKRTSSYKNLEEATLASDRLLAQLKKKHLQKDQSSSRSGSLSSRVVRGGDYVRSTAKHSSDMSLNGRANATDFDYETDFGNEPTYYINGVKSEKSEVLKLRKRNILSRTMKLKDTASRNPNGEIWIEVKE